MRCWHHLHPKFVENFIFLTFPFTVLQLRLRNLILHQILIYLKKSSSKTHHFSRFFTTFLLFYIHWIKWCDIPAVPPWCPCLVMSPPLPGGGMVDHQFEPHIILILCVIQIGRLPYPLLARAGTSQGITRAGTPRGNGGDITSFESNVCRIIEKWWKIVKNDAFLMNFFFK